MSYKVSMLICTIFLFLNSQDFQIPNEYHTRVHKDFASNEDLTWSVQLTKKPKRYFSAAFRNIEAPYQKVLDVFQEYQALKDVSNWIKASKVIDTTGKYSEYVSLYFETGAGFFRYWFILDLDSLTTDSFSRCQFYFKQNRVDSLNTWWRENREGGWIVIEDNDYTMNWFARKINDTSTRLGFIIINEPKNYVPAWLIKLSMKVVIPGLLKDIESRVLKVNKEDSVAKNNQM